MSNMSYCRFQNTRGDLRDCSDHIRDKLSEDESYARRSLIHLCVDILTEIGLQIDGNVEQAIAELEENEIENEEDE